MFFAIYRGQVTNDTDPMQRGRLKAIVPDVLGSNTETAWALPCQPSGWATGVGKPIIPAPGSSVWIMFEHGDPEYPVWLGVARIGD